MGVDGIEQTEGFKFKRKEAKNHFFGPELFFVLPVSPIRTWKGN